MSVVSPSIAMDVSRSGHLWRKSHDCGDGRVCIRTEFAEAADEIGARRNQPEALPEKGCEKKARAKAQSWCIKHQTARSVAIIPELAASTPNLVKNLRPWIRHTALWRGVELLDLYH